MSAPTAEQKLKLYAREVESMRGKQKSYSKMHALFNQRLVAEDEVTKARKIMQAAELTVDLLTKRVLSEQLSLL